MQSKRHSTRELLIMSNDIEVFNRAQGRGQQTFTLVEQDRSAVETIAYWILQNIHSAPADKLRNALEICLKWRNFAAVKDAD
jgi:hypothetical protein